MFPIEYKTRLLDLIHYISNLHDKITNDWEAYAEANDIEQMNLKKKKVCDIPVDEKIFNEIEEYRKFLNRINFNELFTPYNQPDFETKSRVKMANSVEYKIGRYIEYKQNGEIPINKCFNDLYGIRVIINADTTHNDI